MNKLNKIMEVTNNTYEFYITISKKSLLDKANLVKERFNSANFKSKSTNSIQHINKVEVVEHGTAVYFWCSHMNMMSIER